MKFFGAGLAVVLVSLAQTPLGEAQVTVVGSSVREHSVREGGTAAGAIRLRNVGSAPASVRVQQRDYLFYADGTSLYPEPGSHERSNGRWIALATTDVEVGPGEEVEVGYRIAVPRDEGLEGTYWSMIMVEPTDPLPPVGGAGEEARLGVRTVLRFGIQVATHVGDARHRLRLGSPRLTRGPGNRQILSFELENAGAAAYRPKVSLELYDGGGALLETLEVQRGLLYPGTSALQRFELPAHSGTVEALVVVDTGAPEVFGGQFTLSLGATR